MDAAPAKVRAGLPVRFGCARGRKRMWPWREAWKSRRGRPALMQGELHDSLWVGSSGSPSKECGISAMLSRASRVRFGYEFRAHRFRHAAATTTAEADLALGVAAGLLGISSKVVERSYQQVNQLKAARRFQAILEIKRSQLRPLVARELAVASRRRS
jgi:integrase